MITKDKAIEILENTTAFGIFPVFDCVVFRESDNENGILREYTFRQLLCIAYDLIKKETLK